MERLFNGINDGNKMIRKSSLTELIKYVKEKERKNDNSDNDNDIVELGEENANLKRIVLAGLGKFDDVMEKNRELSIQLVSAIFEIYGNNGNFLSVEVMPKVLDVIVSRLTVTSGNKLIEPTEEIRQALAELFHNLLQQQLQNQNQQQQQQQQRLHQSLLQHLNQSNVLPTLSQLMLKDNNPNVKKEIAKVIVTICAISYQNNGNRFITNNNNLISIHSSELAKCLLVGGLSHNHSQIRSISLQALDKVVLLSTITVLEELYEPLKSLTRDQSPSVRESLCSTVSDWLIYHQDRYSCEVKLLPILLQLIADDIPSVSSAALISLEKIGSQYELDHEDDVKDEQNYGDVRNYVLLPSSFHSLRPPLGARLVVRNRFSVILPSVFKSLSDWKADVRIQSANLLEVLLAYVEEYATQQLDVLLRQFSTSIKDEEALVVKRIMSCIQLLGQYVKPNSYIPIILPQLSSRYQPTASASSTGTVITLTTVSQRANLVFILAKLLSGVNDANEIGGCIPQIIETLVDDELLNSEDATMKYQIVDLVAVLIDKGKNQCVVGEAGLFYILLHMQGCFEDGQLQKLATQQMDNLANTIFGNNNNGGVGISRKKMYESHFRPILDSLLSNHKQWTKHSSQWKSISVLFRQVGCDTICLYLSDIIPICVECVKINYDAEVRLSQLALVDDIYKLIYTNNNNSVDGNNLAVDDDVAFDSNMIELIISSIIHPCLIWRMGKASTVIRLASLRCLETLCLVMATMIARNNNNNHNHNNNNNNVMAIFREKGKENIIALLQDAMEDDSVEVRLQAITDLNLIILNFRNLFNGEEIRSIYPSLLKRLDDSRDDIRLIACKALKNFIDGLTLSRNIHNNNNDNHVTDDVTDFNSSSTHLPEIVKCLLIHYGDTSINKTMKETIYEAIKSSSLLSNPQVSSILSNSKEFNS